MNDRYKKAKYRYKQAEDEHKDVVKDKVISKRTIQFLVNTADFYYNPNLPKDDYMRQLKS